MGRRGGRGGCGSVFCNGQQRSREAERQMGRCEKRRPGLGHASAVPAAPFRALSCRRPSPHALGLPRVPQRRIPGVAFPVVWAARLRLLAAVAAGHRRGQVAAVLGRRLPALGGGLRAALGGHVEAGEALVGAPPLAVRLALRRQPRLVPEKRQDGLGPAGGWMDGCRRAAGRWGSGRCCGRPAEAVAPARLPAAGDAGGQPGSEREEARAGSPVPHVGA